MNIRCSVRKIMFSILLAISPVAVQAESVAALTLLMNYLTPLETLQSDFRQQTLDARQQSLQAFTGQFLLMRNGPRLWWETAAPNEQILRVQNDTLWTLDIALEQLVIQPLGQLWEQSPALLLTGREEEIARRFKVEVLEIEPVAVSFLLIPRDSSHALERIEMRFVDGKPDRIRLLDSFQQTTLLVFQNMVINQLLDEMKFELDIPTYFDVIDQRTP